ncbi:protein outspread isoform X2 [Drosophila sulfurigaster albostrigata]|uniref:protein outspread isoform X2 n=1 Tax=Drosophila sulfurigaster albostrigata TaxID=89887 RepID=UPI002D21953A|nr:protein outspread isoform X2 [Drosophila sulfurigaster albostrigata]
MSTSTITTTTTAAAAPAATTAVSTPPLTASCGRTADCRKFSPNIFNKSKCSHCFRQREEHSAAALECNRASRKVSKCGYLFVAPDWDFSNPLYRTKRWQRRWFVLYDDGELTYSVDDFPETVPQACIDMTKVMEVSSAEEVTGHTNSIAITAPERVTYVKGISSEESQWWLNILTAFPKSKGRHKRSTTLPGGQINCLRQSANVDLAIKLGNRHSSYHKDTLTSSQSASSLIGNLDCPSSRNSTPNDDEDDGVETGEDEDEDDDENDNGDDDEEQQVSTSRKAKVTSSSSSIGGQDENNRNAGNEITNRGCLLIEDIRRDEKSIKDIANTITNLSQQQSKRWSTMAVNNALNNQHQHHYQYHTSCDETDFQVMSSGKSLNVGSEPQTIVNLRPKSLPLAANSTPAIVSAVVKKIPTVLVSQQQQQQQQQQHSLKLLKEDNSKSNKSSGRLELQLQLKPAKHYQHERGDPDGGCNLDELCANYMSKSDELRSVSKLSNNSNKNAASANKTLGKSVEESLNAKKGWLMKLDNRTGEWSKHWFTLSGAALFYYRDPLCEERGVLDGVLDVNSLSTVVEEPSASKQHAFQLITWDKQRLFLASLSPSSRNSWLAILRSAAGLTQQLETSTTTPIATSSAAIMKSSDIEQDFIKAQLQQHSTHPLSSSPATPGTPGTPCTPANGPHFSSDEEYRTASEGGRRDSLDWGSPLSPSPPVLRSCLRNRSLASLHKRSRSSPPSSRRSTVDSVTSDELSLMAVPEEIRPERELKQQCETLRTEAKIREARMSELLTTLQRTEQELTARLQEQQQQLNGELTSAKQSAAELVHTLSLQLTESQCKIKQLEDRLAQGIEENEGLYKRLRDFQVDNNQVASLSNLQRHKMKRMDSLSDLTTISDIDPYCLQRDSLAEEYNELRTRFEKAVNEIRAMKRELKQSQNQYDALELIQTALQQKLERCQMEDGAQLQLMAARIQDLTIKYSTSERQVRALKQKLAKSERRRSLSLKGKEQLELKLSELQRETVEHKSGDCSTASTTESSGDSSSQSSPLNAHLLQRLHSLEHVLLNTKERLEQSLNQLQQLRVGQRSRRSVSPLNERKDGLRQLERALVETCVLVTEQMELSCLQEACHKCSELHQRIEKLTTLHQQTETDLQRSEQLLEQREGELAISLEKCASQENEQQVLLQQRNELSDELGRQQERCKRLEKRLDLLEREHGKQLECLRQVYRHEHDNVSEDQSFRKRYQTEIEQLRTLCEKGLSAMESSHRRLICDMEEKHKIEIDRLLAEKETALAEETQATLAALDAMRKAHESEVQREVSRFKSEFLHQVQRGEHMRGDGAKLKEEELDELRLEILSFSEKYSIKCVENAALEEKLHLANGKLRHFQQMQQLELRNQQFRAHLASDDPSSDVHFVQGLTAGSKDDASCEDSEPVQCAPQIMVDTRTNTTTTTRTRTTTTSKRTRRTTIEPPASGVPEKLDQNLFVIPYHRQNHCQVSAASIPDSGIDIVNIDKFDRVDNIDELVYEPCYKPSDIFALYQNRLCFQGLKSNSTFGKNLRKSTARTSPASLSSPSPASSSSSSTSPSNAEIRRTATIIVQSPVQKGPSHNRIYKTDAVINIQQQQHAGNAIKQEKAQ